MTWFTLAGTTASPEETEIRRMIGEQIEPVVESSTKAKVREMLSNGIYLDNLVERIARRIHERTAEDVQNWIRYAGEQLKIKPQPKTKSRKVKKGGARARR